MRTYPALDLTVTAAAGPDANSDAPSIPPELADRLSTTLDDLQPTAIHEAEDETPPRWRVFFGSPAARAAAREALSAAFPPGVVGVSDVDVEDEDWAARTQAALPAIRIGRIVVAPPWDVPAATRQDTPDDLIVVIKPSTGFGTGHHESTRLCLALLQAQDVRGLSVLDVGTGSGVLALSAARLGAGVVTGIDEDADAIAAARENAGLNGLAERGRPELMVTDLRAYAAGPCDLVLANLTGGLLERVADLLAALARPGGALIIAGYQRWEAARVLAAFTPHARVVDRPFENGWEAALLRRHP